VRVSNPLRTLGTALFLACAFAAPGLATAPDREDLARITIENFGQVNDMYFRGAQPEGRDYADLKATGVKTIIDLTDEGGENRPSATRAGLQFFDLPMSSTSPPSATQVDQFLRIVNDPANLPVYVHCKGGRHRTGTLTAIYRMTHDGWSADQAYEEMLKYDFDYGFGHGDQKKFVFAFARDRARAVASVKATQQ
jgi:protein tyrosine/serine phosphatase